MLELMKTIDWSPLFISFKTGILATVLTFFSGDKRRKADYEAEQHGKIHCRWYLNIAIGTPAYCGRVLSSVDLQPSETLRQISF